LGKDNYINQKIDEECAKVKVDSYQDVALKGSFMGGVRAMWAGGALGIGFGAIVGVVAPFFPLLAGGALGAAVSAIPASVAAFSAIGMSTGRASGSTASAAKEQEKRMKEWTIKQLLHDNPNASIAADQPEENPQEAPKSFWQKTKDAYLTYCNPRVGLVFAALGVVGGLVMAAAALTTGIGAIMPAGAMAALTGLKAAEITTGVVVAYSAGVMGAFGALFGLSGPKMVSDLTPFMGDLLGGKSLGRGWGPEPQKEKAAELKLPAETLVQEAAAEPKGKDKTFASDHLRFSLQGVIDRTTKESSSANPEMVGR
jgi:hypothetical protein